MKWLDRVKACDPFDPENRRKVYAKLSGTEGDVVLKVMERSWRQLEVARFIAIAEQAELACLPIDPDYANEEGCTVCGTGYDYERGEDGKFNPVIKHDPSCPYSDGWEGEWNSEL